MNDKERAIQVATDWVHEYLNNKEQFLSRRNWSTMVEAHNVVYFYVKAQGETNIQYFPKKENSSNSARCGTCLSRMIRNITWFYYREVIGDQMNDSPDLKFVCQRVKGNDDKLAQPVLRREIAVALQNNTLTPKSPKAEAVEEPKTDVEAPKEASKEVSDESKVSTPKKTRKPRKTTKKASE